MAIDVIGVVGAGFMGTGIAESASARMPARLKVFFKTTRRVISDIDGLPVCLTCAP